MNAPVTASTTVPIVATPTVAATAASGGRSRALGWRGRAVRLAAGLVLGGGVALLAACASGPPAPDWAVQAHDAHQRGTQSHLLGNTRAAEADWARAHQEAARTADPQTVARLVLAQCAARVAALGDAGCVAAVAPWRDDLTPELLAYARHLDARWTDADPARLPAAQQGVAALLQRPAAPDRDGALAQRLRQQPDPLSRLVGAAVAWRAGQAGPQVVALALDTATEQGWRRPLLAWLTVALAQAEQAGDREQVQRLQRRLALLAPTPPAQTPAAQ